MNETELKKLILSKITDELTLKIVDKLDDFARDYDHHQYGLPWGGESYDEMKQLVREILIEELTK